MSVLFIPREADGPIECLGDVAWHGGTAAREVKIILGKVQALTGFSADVTERRFSTYSTLPLWHLCDGPQVASGFLCIAALYVTRALGELAWEQAERNKV